MSKRKKHKKIKRSQNDTTFQGKSKYALKVKENRQMYGIQRRSKRQSD